MVTPETSKCYTCIGTVQEGGRFLEMTLREIDILDKNTFQKYFRNVQTSTNTYKVRKFATL